MKLPTDLEIYHYPFYYYLRYVPDVPDREPQLAMIREQLPSFLEKTKAYHPLFFYLWWLAAGEISPETLYKEAATLVAVFESDGGIKTPLSATALVASSMDPRCANSPQATWVSFSVSTKIIFYQPTLPHHADNLHS